MNPLEFEIRRNSRGEWYWSFQTNGGRRLCRSVGSYKSRTECLDALNSVKNNAASAAVYDLSVRPVTRLEEI